jgi:hypothetical protein
MEISNNKKIVMRKPIKVITVTSNKSSLLLRAEEEKCVFFFFHWFHRPLGPWPLIFSFMIISQTAGLLGRVTSSSQCLYLNIGQHNHRINTYTYQTSMPCVRFEPTISASERAKTVHALDRSATVTGQIHTYNNNIIYLQLKLQKLRLN